MNKTFFHYALPPLFVCGVALSVASCTDDDLTPGRGGDALVGFSVNDVQGTALSQAGAGTRGCMTPGLSSADLSGHRLEAHSNRSLDVCLIETTVEGVNPVKADPGTRAEIKTAIDGDFSTTGLRGDAEDNILTTPEWFHAAKTSSAGQLYGPVRWAWSLPHARFFAVFPSKENYTKLAIGTTTPAGSPTVDFTAEPDVKRQVDFMAACSGHVHYATQGVAPAARLDFRHALTAIRFAVGQNLSWNRTIDKVELRNAVMKSRYTLSRELGGTGAAWDHSADTRGTASLSDISVSTAHSPNTVIMGNPGDNYTFFMIPQVLTGNGVKAYIHFTDGTEINVDLKGEWKAGTTRTYKISQKSSDWSYVLTSTNPSRPAYYDETTSQPYTITSYREKGGERQPVPWKVIGYDANGDGMFTMAEKPDWLVSLSKDGGAGGTAAEEGTATLLKGEMKDLLNERNEGLKKAAPLGSAGNYYDLSTKGGQAARSTANCYVISAPGYYRIPLVYGNAITGGKDNTKAYICNRPTPTPLPEDRFLRKFKDHLGNDIDNPWIEKTHGGANAGVNGAKLVWADEANLFHLAAGSAAISHDAAGNAYLQFEVRASDIKSGNAVVAATKDGTVVWSWHLWFAPQSALTTIEVTNHQGVKYNFTTETVGWKPTKWEGTVYQSPRSVKFRVEQTIANNGKKQYTDITITQKPGNKREGIVTLYQFGNKNAYPGTDDNLVGSFNIDLQIHITVPEIIQNPQKYYPTTNMFPHVNSWAADDITGGYSDNPVIKTVYDPSPVGFKMPASNAFTGFTSDGKLQSDNDKINADFPRDFQQYKDNYGHNFWTNSNKTATIFFPIVVHRLYVSGYLSTGYDVGPCWTAMNCIMQSFNISVVNPAFDTYASSGVSIRPVTE
ncbi:hypothetical protein [Prevotella multiformis]|uniref:hypothetical protein n=1 Tax=Prevotella multiformis TaxID=282402 RepID=UPI0023F2F9F7|nr:hypothetical protein [Prevotella multiformis]